MSPSRAPHVRELSFVPSARLQRFLGQELVADSNLAIAEFVKNAYDAGATEVRLSFKVQGRPKDRQILTISDNGTGMDIASFERNWMKPGFSSKALNAAPEPVNKATEAWKLKAKRTPIGEKGLGRFASGRLSDQLEVFTRQDVDDPWLHVVFDWTAFEPMELALQDIKIPSDQETEPVSAVFDVGTIVVMEGLRLDWTGRVPGRKVRGRSDHRLGRLRQDLSILLQPFAPDHYFTISIECDDAYLNERYGGTADSDWPDVWDYAYHFVVHEENDSIMVDRKVTRSAEIAEQLDRQEVTEEHIDLSSPTQSDDERPATLHSGPFAGTFIYFPNTAQRWKDLGVPTGVFLYRDGVRVDPYGHSEDDWLGARARKAARQGHAAIQPNHLAGHVQISRSTNPELIDMSNRQGLVENEAYDDFVAHARAEFAHFEELILREYVEPQWTSPQTKVQRAAERTRSFGIALVRSILHSVRQHVAGLGAEMATLRSMISNGEPPEHVVLSKLHDLERRSTQHLEAIDKIIQRFVYFDEETLTDAEKFDARDALQEVIERARPLAESHQVDLRASLGAHHDLVLQRQALVEAVYQLVTNGIQAPRPSDRSPAWVEVATMRSSAGNYEILVSDNASGVDPSVLNGLGENLLSTKGRPGIGLMLVREFLALFGASYSLVQTSEDGTTFRITVPHVSSA